MAMPRSQRASTDALPEALPDLHTAQVDLHAKEEHLQNPTVDLKPTTTEVQQTADGLQQAKLETPNQSHKQKEKQQLGEEQQQDKENHTNSNQKITLLQLHTDVNFDKEVLTLHCKDRGKKVYDTLEIGNNKNLNIQKINDSKCELDNRIVGNSEIYTRKEVLDETNYNSTNTANTNEVNCDRNNNLNRKDASTSETVNNKKISDASTSEIVNNRKISDASTSEIVNNRKISDTSTSEPVNNRKISDVVILINDEQCDDKIINSTCKNNKVKKPKNPIYNKERLQPPLNKTSSVPTIKIPPQLNKIASAPDLRLSPKFTDYKNSYLQRNDTRELYLKKDSPRESINTNKHAKTKTIEVVKMVQSNCCIFCGEGSQLEGTGLGQLITFCQCNASAHNACLMAYVTFPSSAHERCCVCRSKLQYMVIDKDTPMHIKYAIVLVLISMAYLALALLSIHLTQELIPMGEIHEFLYLLIIGNVGFIPPAVIVFIISCLLNFIRPRPKLDDSGGTSLFPGGFLSWFGCNSDDCDEKSCGGDTCGFVLAAFCLLSVMVVLISASIYIAYNIYLYYKSFKLKSKKSIRFSCERKNKNKSTV